MSRNIVVVADAKLQQARRKAASDNTPSAKAALLRERVRCGDMGVLEVGCEGCHGGGKEWHVGPCDPETFDDDPHGECQGTGRVEWPVQGDAGRLALAAVCGSEAARLVLGPGDHCYRCERGGRVYAGPEERTGAARCAECLSLPAWLQGLTRWPQEVLVRAAVAAARVACAVWEEQKGKKVLEAWATNGIEAHLGIGEAVSTAPRQVIKAVEAWLECPCDEHRAACLSSAAAIRSAEPGFVVWLGLGTYYRDLKTLDHGFRSAMRLADEGKIRAAICDALIAWCL